LCAEYSLHVTRLGVVTPVEDAALEVLGQFRIPVEELRVAWRGTLAAAMSGH